MGLPALNWNIGSLGLALTYLELRLRLIASLLDGAGDLHSFPLPLTALGRMNNDF